MKVIRSVRDTRGNVIQKQPSGGVGQLKCPKCGLGRCTSKTMPNGRRVMQCNSCSASYVVGSMTSPRVAQPGAVAPTTRTTHHHTAARPAVRPSASPTPRSR
jgi:hypothetical protein